MMGVFCVGCGAGLRAPSCAECGAAARGEQFSEPALVGAADPPQVPDVCCCCLNPREKIRTLHVAVAQSYGDSVTGHVTHSKGAHVPIPWCRRCLRRRRVGIMFGGMVISAVVAILILVTRDPGLIAAGLFAGLIGSVVAGGALHLFLPDRPGHTARCLAVRATGVVNGADGAIIGLRIVFHNRAFAKKWRDLNGS